MPASRERSASSTASGKGDVTNIWVVTPDQKPTLGPNDVILLMQDALSQGTGPIKVLVKQIAQGNA